MSKYYILAGHKAIPTDLMTWAKWSKETENKHVAVENIDNVRISTVFLGFDYSLGEGPLLLFETMVFGGSMDEEMHRYTTWEEAEDGHKKTVERVKKSGRRGE